MRIIAIEGLDKAGKHSATTILRDYFEGNGLTVEEMSFPNYDTPMGKLIKKWLNGEFEADSEVFELLQAADKQHGQRFIRACEARGVDVLLIDRYVHTLWAYGAYDNDELWLQELTKYLRLPHVVLYLDVEPEVSMHRRGKFGDNDRYEADLERLRYTKSEFTCLLKEKRDVIDFTVINANNPFLFVKAKVLLFAEEQYQQLKQKDLKEDTTVDFA